MPRHWATSVTSPPSIMPAARSALSLTHPQVGYPGTERPVSTPSDEHRHPLGGARHAWRRPRVPAPAAFSRPILRCLRRLPSIRTRTRLITTLTNNLTVTARTCSVGDPPTPRDSLPRRTLDEDMMRGTYHPVPLRAVRHQHPPATPRPPRSRAPPPPHPHDPSGPQQGPPAPHPGPPPGGPSGPHPARGGPPPGGPSGPHPAHGGPPPTHPGGTPPTGGRPPMRGPSGPNLPPG